VLSDGPLVGWSQYVITRDRELTTVVVAEDDISG
jgi:hypothetical protein